MASEADALATHAALTATAHGGLAGLGAANALWLPAPIYKTADQSVSSTLTPPGITFLDDTDLLFAVGANEKWWYMFLVLIDGATADDWKGQLVGPTGSTVRAAGSGLLTTATGVTTGMRLDNEAGGFFSGTITGTRTSELIVGTIANGTTAGTLKLQWAQFNASATATKVCLGSGVDRKRIA